MRGAGLQDDLLEVIFHVEFGAVHLGDVAEKQKQHLRHTAGTRNAAGAEARVTASAGTRRQIWKPHRARLRLLLLLGGLAIERPVEKGELVHRRVGDEPSLPEGDHSRVEV